MMARKAHLFSDNEIFQQIIAVEREKDWHNAPKLQKKLGRKN